MNLQNIGDLDRQESEQEKKLSWELVSTSGHSPGAVSHHTSVVFGDKMYLFGGSKSNGDENKNFYHLDLKNFRWEVIHCVR
jgi:hypothetical protein